MFKCILNSILNEEQLYIYEELSTESFIHSVIAADQTYQQITIMSKMH